MKSRSLPVVVVGVLSIGVLSICGLSAQSKPTVVVQAFTVASGVDLPYDMSQLQGQLVAELKVELGKEFAIVAEAPTSPDASTYTLDGQITGWRPGNAAKRLMVGLGSGREASDIEFHVVDKAGQKVVDRKETVRTNFYSQGAGSTGTLAHPIAQKIADRIKDARLK